MAKPSTWIPHVEAFVSSSRPSDQQGPSIDAIAALLKNGSLTIDELVREMGLYLTTTDNIIRARGILLLSELLTCLLSKPLDSTTIHSLVTFFIARLADWQALRGALNGCLALLRRKSSVGAVLDSDAQLLAKSFLQNVQVQSLAQHDRKLCFELLECLLDCYADIVLLLGDELIYGICEAIDEEKDPQCLMVAFHLVEELVCLFPDPSESFVEDLFEILGRYFPVYFTHPENVDTSVKRDDLSRALMHAFGATPSFEPYAIPLLLEKLSSSFPLAKLDSLKYLSYCSLRFGVDRMMKHAKAIWSSLKGVILSSSPQELFFSLDLEQECSDNNETMKEALICLQKLISELDSSSDVTFGNLVVEDEYLETMFRSVANYKSYADIPSEGKQKLHALGKILPLAAKASNKWCDRVFQRFFPTLTDMLAIPLDRSLGHGIPKDSNMKTGTFNFGPLYLYVALLSACKYLVIVSEKVSIECKPVQESWLCLIQNSFDTLASGLGSTLLRARNGDNEEAYMYMAVKGLHVLAIFSGFLVPMAEAIYKDILMMLMSIIESKTQDKILWQLTLKALVQIGVFSEKFHDSQSATSYLNIVVEKLISLLSRDDPDMPFQLKLEATSEICAVGTSCALRVIRGLEEVISFKFIQAFVEASLNSADILVHLLECYSMQLLPWLQKIADFDKIPFQFALKIWNYMENPIFNFSTQKQDLLEATMKAMRTVVGCCTPEDQELVVQKAYSIFSATEFFQSVQITSFFDMLKLGAHAENSDALSCRDEWIMSLFASVIIPLYPQTPLPEAEVILKIFMSILLLKGHTPIAQALGSMVNKWPLKLKETDELGSFTLEEVLDVMFKSGLQVVLESVSFCKFVGSARSRALIGLGWIGKGLLMRGHEKVREVALLLLNCLLSNRQEAAIVCDDVTIRLAADAYHILLSDSEVCLNRKFHATIRPLYKQHFFSSMMPIFLSTIKGSDSLYARSNLYRAFGHVISETPLIALVAEAKKLVPLLLEALSILSEDILDKDLTYSLLLILSGILTDENGKEVVLDNVHTMVTLLLKLLSYSHMMLVRETAIQCLVALSTLPHPRIYPFRPQVLQATSNALDDRKRSVRQEAVRCRQAWASVGGRNLRF